MMSDLNSNMKDKFKQEQVGEGSSSLYICFPVNKKNKVERNHCKR